MSQRTDGSLVAAAVQGDLDAFGELTRRHADSFARYATQMLGDRDDAEDALQAAFVRAYRGLAGCRDPERFAAWLHRIVVNECRRFAESRRNRERRILSDDASLEAASPVDSVGDAAIREEILYGLGKLPPEQREAFLLKYVEDLSYEEMAELTGVRVSALKMRVSRACERLRELLEGVYR